MPILNLPILPLLTPSQPVHPGRPRAPLRRSADADQEATHDNACLDEEDDEEDGEDGAEETGLDEDSDGSSEDDEISPSQRPGPSRLPPLPAVDTSGFSVPFADAEQCTPHPPAALLPRTPSPTHQAPQPRLVPMPASPDRDPRPSLMVDLESTRKDKNTIISPKLGGVTPKSCQLSILAVNDSDDLITSSTLRRRRSLPTYEPSSDPPPYPDPVFRRRAPAPPDEEGREALPPYTNTIFMCGAMPRKMEFLKPGVQSKDRKWRRVYCVLEGTALRIYNCPPEAAGVSAIEHWWESKVGVGDISVVNAVTARSPNSTAERAPKILEEPTPDAPVPPTQLPPPTKSKLGIPSKSLGHAPRPPIDPIAAAARRSVDVLSSSRPSMSSTASARPSMDTSASRPSVDGPSLFSRSRLRPSLGTSPEKPDKRSKDKNAPFTPDQEDLIRQYTLQNAESGLASDYVKRKNVIRVRMEGEQFLLQAKDVTSVVDWIETSSSTPASRRDGRPVLSVVALYPQLRHPIHGHFMTL
ncbi:uncharacterized protein BXZ73DRAFT_88208 [Epithele typhae]|uniref:uncharacterized protein n=1 Tax=Epithele typhae TaxID=378194 RepID=UPI0020082CCD|nr:uncharacterized protein BXZ73DRAFT_88208 [Epithele typhae]KAH9941786.1 hypothetical protein BXZ73DRAFT_88208 [Epithele typhae]